MRPLKKLRVHSHAADIGWLPAVVSEFPSFSREIPSSSNAGKGSRLTFRFSTSEKTSVAGADQKLKCFSSGPGLIHCSM